MRARTRRRNRMKRTKRKIDCQVQLFQRVVHTSDPDGSAGTVYALREFRRSDGTKRVAVDVLWDDQRGGRRLVSPSLLMPTKR